MKKINQRKRVFIFGGILASLLLILVIILRTGYCVRPDLYYCQGLAIEYVSLLREGLLLSEIATSEYKDKSFIRFSFETGEDADYFQIEQYIYETWTIMKENIKNNVKLRNAAIDIEIKNNKKAIGSGIRNFGLDGDYLDEQWMIYNAFFYDWEDVEKYTDLYGAVGCNILMDIDADSVDSGKLSKLRQIYVHVGTEEEDRIRNDIILQEIYPYADVDHLKYDRMDIIYVIGG